MSLQTFFTKKLLQFGFYVILPLLTVSCVLETRNIPSTDRYLVETPPSKPTGLKISQISPFGVKLDWELPVDPGTSGSKKAELGNFQVQFSTSEDFDINLRTFYVNGTSHSFENLLPETSYYLRVQASNNNSISSKITSDYAYIGETLETSIFSTTKIPSLSPPKTLTWVPNSSEASKGEVTWEQPENLGKSSDGKSYSEIDHYVFEYSLDSHYKTKTISKKVPNVKTPSEKLGSLIPAKTYYVRVKAVNKEGVESQYLSKEFTANSLASPPDPVTSLSLISNEGGGEITIEFEKPTPTRLGTLGDGVTKATIKSFDIIYRKEDGFSASVKDEFLEEDSSSETQIHILKNLDGNETYHIEIVVKNTAGMKSIASNTLSVPVAPAPKRPSTISVNEIDIRAGDSKDAVNISWEKPADPGLKVDDTPASIAKYSICYYGCTSDDDDSPCEIVDFSLIKEVEVDASKTEVTISDLIGNQRYAFKITATNDVDRSSTSDPKFYTTPSRAAAPDKVQQVAAKNDNNSKDVIVEWFVPNGGLKPSGEKAEIVNYKIYYSTDIDFQNKEEEQLIEKNDDLGNGKIIISREKIKPLTTYHFYVIATNSNCPLSSDNTDLCTSDKSDIASFTTLEYATSPDEVTDFSSYSATSTSIFLRWDEGDPGDNGNGTKSIITGADIFYSSTNSEFDPSNPNNYEGLVTIRGGNSNINSYIEIENLKPDTTYYFKIAVYNKADERSGYIPTSARTTK